MILAGITIATLTGDNGIFNNAKKASTETEIAKTEEEANLLYQSRPIDKSIKDGTTDDIALSEVVSDLQSEGYTIKSVSSGGDSITGISLSNNTLTIGVNGTATLKVNFLGSTGGAATYYALLKGKYYEMTLNNGKITLSKDGKSESEIGGSSGSLDAESSDTDVIKIGDKGSDSVTISGLKSGTSTITVKYGEYSQTCTATVVKMPTETSAADASTSIKNDHGTIDVIWLEGTTNTVTQTPNAPVMKDGMSNVTWTKSDDTWTEDTTANSNWYSYTAGTGTTDNLESRWANVKNADGSYFVWIPRYAYRITYYDSTGKVSGFYDGHGMWDINGNLKYSLDDGVETVDYNGNKYIVHPAFCGKSTSGSGYDNGQWSEALQGFWVAKYEMSRKGATSSNDTSSTYKEIQFLSVPGVSSARYINIGNMYTVAKAYDTTKNSHLMKNSEWGAVAYLTHSQYGRNGNEIDINNSSTYITGNGGGSTSASSATGVTNAYNTTKGAKASSTGNIYGIYDLSGGAWEYVAGFDGKGSSSYVDGSSYGQAMTTTIKDTTNSTYTSNNLITVYSNGGSTYSGSTIFNICKVGDATKEVWESGNYGWNGDYSDFVGSDTPFFGRGGFYNAGSDAGVFASCGDIGGAHNDVSFRVVLASL